MHLLILKFYVAILIITNKLCNFVIKLDSMAENKFDNVLGAANKVLMFPSTTLKDACAEYSVNLSPITGYVIGGIISGSPIVLLATWVLGKYKKNKRENEEKERMKNEIIRKQQAIINKLKRDNQLNQAEIKNLKDTLEMLENVLNQVNRA